MNAGAAPYDVVVVGAGPNGLAAAVTLGRAGLSVLVVEGSATCGGGARTEEATLPGFLHDPCSTVHPLGAGSPFFRSLGLERYGLEWVHAPVLLAHVVDRDSVVCMERSLEATVARLGRFEGDAYRRLMEPLVERFEPLTRMLLGPLRWPEQPFEFARFGLSALQSMKGLAESVFRTSEGRASALLAGIAAHAMLPLDAPASASFALVLGMAAHAVGWPLARGGSQAITNALLACLREAGGDVAAGRRVNDLRELPEARAYVLDLTPKEILRIAGHALPAGYRRALRRFRYGPGVFKMDFALSEPIPWTDQSLRHACTVHLSGSLHEISAGERAVHAGRIPERPFVLLVQPSLFDGTRAPPGRHVAWAYCHVPNGSTDDASRRIEDHIERHAPGFRDVILAKATRDSAHMEAANPNYAGGDINGGVSDLAQLFFRPAIRLDPYSTPAPDVFVCSSSTPPGGGVHGQCGYWAAQSVMKRAFGKRLDDGLELRHLAPRNQCPI
jgi:phytoene dehydrogenase-like protein